MKSINGQQLMLMLKSGAANLSNHHAEIDSLNVFPVPDGDTGTNMSMTFTAGVKNALSTHSEDLTTVAKSLSKGLLMGARGNSGVITSQIFRGLYQSIDGKKELNALDLADAFCRGSEVAYKAVMRPVEGTILTVIRESSYYAKKYVEDNPSVDAVTWFAKFIELAKESLELTPESLPILKEVGVVDSGGAGLVVILEGMYSALIGKPIELKGDDNVNDSSTVANVDHDEFGYCTEFILRLSEDGMHVFTEENMKKSLSQLGNSIVVVQDEELVKVHVHTLTPGEALNIGQRYGEFLKLKIENMQEQHEHLHTDEKTVAQAEPKEYALIAVAAGQGLTDLFKEYRCDTVISGGQTMNPSTEDFVAAIQKLNAKHILIFPNNSNIILAAQQAQAVLEDLDIHVLPTKTIPQGLSACLMFNPDAPIEDNLKEMNEAISSVKTGQVTYAIKDTTFEGLQISCGDYMGMYEKNIVSAIPDMMKCTKELIDQMIDDDNEIVTLIFGEDATSEQAEEIVAYIEDKYDVEVEVTNGQQPVYCFIIGVE